MVPGTKSKIHIQTGNTQCKRSQNVYPGAGACIHNVYPGAGACIHNVYPGAAACLAQEAAPGYMFVYPGAGAWVHILAP